MNQDKFKRYDVVLLKDDPTHQMYRVRSSSMSFKGYVIQGLTLIPVNSENESIYTLLIGDPKVRKDVSQDEVISYKEYLIESIL